MRLVTGREFRFTFFGNDPASPEHEYGAMVKTVFELETDQLDGTGDLVVFPGRGLAPVGGYFGPNVQALVTPTPTLKFHYLGISVFPNAAGPRPTITDPAVEFRWIWTVGNPFLFSDVIWIDTGNLNMYTLNPARKGTSASPYAGIITEVDPLVSQRSGGLEPRSSFIFPPVDAVANPNLELIWFPTTYADWDGWAFLNLYLLVGFGPASSYLTAGVWRFVHLFSEMTR